MPAQGTTEGVTRRGGARGHYAARRGSDAARAADDRSAARAARFSERDEQYRRALGLPDGAELPHELGNANGHAPSWARPRGIDAGSQL